ncbi:cytochrome c nitrite reductase small subunit [Candidatus Sumerlaeota bacterium]|nr:cytochrome c nitrite reductase small subunit [Candidatus Sumerlaeota bacterium]
MTKTPFPRRSAILGLGIASALLGGAALGIGLYTFVYARGASYLTDDPAACANCHVMFEQYDAWRKSSHHAVAVCNDCHTPHNLVGKYYTKGRNGYHHSLAFTTGRFHDPIRIAEFNRRIVEDSCRRCHGDIVDAIDTAPDSADRLSCAQCHPSVGHLH